jgi:hypothetical protein
MPDALPRSCSPSSAVMASKLLLFGGRKSGYCAGCLARFAEPGDRSPKCAALLRLRRHG